MYSRFCKNAERTVSAFWLSSTVPCFMNGWTSAAVSAFLNKYVFAECSSWTTLLIMTSPTRPLSVAALPIDVRSRGARRPERDRRQVVIRRHAERVVDVDDDGAALAQVLDSGPAEPRIDVVGRKLRQLDHLRVDVDPARRQDRADPRRGIGLLHVGPSGSARCGRTCAASSTGCWSRARDRPGRRLRRSAARAARRSCPAGTPGSRPGGCVRSRPGGSRASGCSTTRSRPAAPTAPPGRSPGTSAAPIAGTRGTSRRAGARTDRSRGRFMSRRMSLDLGPSAPRSRATAASSPSAPASSASSVTSAIRAVKSCSRSLFHSIWYAVRIGTRSSMSEADAMNAARVSPPSQRRGRRRPRVRTICQRSTA